MFLRIKMLRKELEELRKFKLRKELEESKEAKAKAESLKAKNVSGKQIVKSEKVETGNNNEKLKREAKYLFFFFCLIFFEIALRTQ